LYYFLHILFTRKNVFEKVFYFTSLFPCGFYLSFYISSFGEEIAHARSEIMRLFFDGDFYLSLDVNEKITVSLTGQREFKIM
jgi:hypothetical protein